MAREGGRSRSKGYRRRKKGSSKKKPPSPKQGDQGLNRSDLSEMSDIPVISYNEIEPYFNGFLGINLSEEDERRLLLGKDAWEESLLFFHNPAIPDPRFVFDKTKFIGFFIEMNTWQVVMNLANSPHLILDKEIFNYYHALALHEISHYIVCPYDTIMNGRLIHAALSKVPEKLSPVVVNVFSDLLVDMKLFLKKPEVMEFELRQTLNMSQNVGKTKEEKDHSVLFKLLMKTYELMWGINLQLPKKEYEDVVKIAQNITKIMMKDFEDFTKWEEKVKKIAAILKDILIDDFRTDPLFQEYESMEEMERMEGMGDSGEDSSSEYSDVQGRSNIPLDVQLTMGDPTEIKSKNKGSGTGEEDKSGKSSKKGPKGGDSSSEASEEDQKDAETLANEMNLTDFVKVNRVMGLVPREEAIATYYRGISKNLINIKVVQKKPAGAIPTGIEPWRVGDPLESLDILQTILVSPKIIPNVTTRKWTYKEGFGFDTEESLPDLFLVVDSSGSMSWEPFSKRKSNKSPYHLALTASFAALQLAIKKNSKVAAINFSDSFIYQSWTKDYRKIEKILLQYQCMGTVLPVSLMKKICKQAERKSLIILITDFEIYNWENSLCQIEEIISMGNRLVGFFIGGNNKELESEDFIHLQEMGVKFYAITKIDDLIGLVIKEVKEIYE